MKIKLCFYVFAVFFIVDFSFAKNEIKRRRPVIDSTVQDSDGNYFDQLALDSRSYSSSKDFFSPDDYQTRYQAANDDFRNPTPKKSEKVQYVTPEPYNFSQDYVHHALKAQDTTNEKRTASSFLEYSKLDHDDMKKTSRVNEKKTAANEFEDYNYYFPESKRINSRSTTKAPAKYVPEKYFKPQPTATVKDVSNKYFKTKTSPALKDPSEKYYKPQSPGAVITKDTKANGSDLVNSYHYYYPDESNIHEKARDNNMNYPMYSPTFPSSTRAPSTTKTPKSKFLNRKKTPTVQHEKTSTDSYQYQPVLQRPSDYTPPTDYSNQEFYPLFNPKSHEIQSTATPSTASPAAKRLKTTKKRNYYLPLPSSTMSPSQTTRSVKIRRPSTETPYEDVKQFSVSPSPSSVPNFSTTRAPDLYKYSSPVSSTTLEDFYIRPSTEVTPSASPSPADFESDSSDHTVVIRPKTQYQNYESYEPYKLPPVEERIIYKFVPEETFYQPNKSDVMFHSTSATFPKSAYLPDYYKNLNETAQADMNFYNDFHKNYNYQYFTEQDAAPLSTDHVFEAESDDQQKASKKNMIFSINPQMDEYQHSIIPSNIEEHEMPPPMNEMAMSRSPDNDAEASKNQYFVLYSVDEEEKKQQRKKKKAKEQEVVYHHHHHQHEDKDDDFPGFDSEFDSEFDSDLKNTENVRIVDPGVRGGRPIEFTKDDYLRHIKQAVVQYMKDYEKDPSSSGNFGNQRLQEPDHETPHRPTKTPYAATTASSYKQSLSPLQYKPMAPMKLPKNVYTAGRLKDAIDELKESPHVDLTTKKHKQKPFDLSAIDVGQSYQHVSHFDHSAAMKNIQEFDQSNAVKNQQKKLQFSQQTYHDINNLGFNQKQKQQADDSESDSQSLYKGYELPKKYNTKGNQHEATSYSAMNYDSSRLPRIVPQRDQNDDDDEDNKVDDPVDAPIQIINGIPVANPYNIDLNTLKYMLGGIAQAEVNDQLKDLDESSSNSQKYPANWKSFNPNQYGSFTSNTPVYQVYGQQEGNQRDKKNSGQTGNHGSNSQQSKFPLVGSLTNFNKGKSQNSNKQRNQSSKNNQQFTDFSTWNQMNKKQRVEPQASSSNAKFVLRPVMKSKYGQENIQIKGSINRVRQAPLSTDMRPPPPIKPLTRMRLTKVL